MAETIGIRNRRTLSRFINIATSPALTVAENVAFSQALTADVAVNWAIKGGADASRFSLAGGTLSMTAKDFEAPVDANADNVYEVVVEATDVYGNRKPMSVRVTVTDVGAQ
jgi:hypothetical protein